MRKSGINRFSKLFLTLLSVPFYSGIAHSQSSPDALPIKGEIIEIDLNNELRSEIILRKQVLSYDTRALGIGIESLPGLSASVQVAADSRSKSRVKHIRRYGRAWTVSLITDSNEITNTLRFIENGTTQRSAVGFIQANACDRNVSYNIELKLDISSFKRSPNPQDNIVRVTGYFTDAPLNQATLFKYPSEKSNSLAVLLMRTASAARLINIVDWSAGYPKNIKFYNVDKFYYSNQGLFTRLYIPASILNGSQVTLEHISFGYSYGVCARLAKKRQELEGYN